MSTTKTNLSFKLPMKSVELNWPDLPANVLQTISKKLHDICDFIYFRSVCKSWYTSTTITNVPPQIPWLLSNIDDDGYLWFYSIFSEKIRTIRCPQARLKGIYGPSRGYLYTYQYILGENVRHSLLNPLTKDEVPLQFMENLHEYFLIAMSQNLIKDDDYMVLVNEDAMRMEFYQPHKPKHNFVIGQSCCLQDTPTGGGCFKGMYFMSQVDTCETKVYNISGGYSFVIPPPKMHNCDDKVFFVDWEGKILRIVKHWKNCDPESGAINGYVFDIYQLDVEDEIRHQYRWIKISNISNYVLFLDYIGLASGIFIAATKSTGLSQNCIYYIQRSEDDSKLDCGLYRYDINDARSQKIPCPYRKFWTWYVPSLVSLQPSI